MCRGENACSVKDSLRELGLVTLEDRWHIGELSSSPQQMLGGCQENGVKLSSSGARWEDKRKCIHN